MSAPLNADDSFALAPQDGLPLRILLVEDSRADADLLVAMLEEELPGSVVAVSSTVAEAVPLLSGQLDIAITDLSLPDAEGLQALSAILTARPDIAVVVMTGRQDQDLALRALSAGAEDYLVKGSRDARGIATAVLYAAQRRGADLRARRYERLAVSLLDAMEAATCAVDRTGTIIAVNKAWRHAARNCTNITRSGLGMSYFEVSGDIVGQGPSAVQAVTAGLGQLLAGNLTRFELDYLCQGHEDERWLSLRINPLPEAGAVLSHVDMSVAKRAESTLSHLTLHDPLTNLPNRQLLADRLAQAMAWAGRTKLEVAVAFVDIDQFKRINDSLGHAAGDELLCAVADRLRQNVRSGDTVARFAGDEFVVVWPDIDSPAQAGRLAQRLTDAMAAPFSLKAATVTVTASVGVVVGGPPQHADDLLLNADAAMYNAKGHGRGLTRMYTNELREGVTARLRTEADLRNGLDRGEFVLHYQPVVDLRSRTVTGVEALLRWRHPDGLRMPDSFIPVAETTGLIVPLGTWVLQEACRQGAAWAAQGLDLELAVNFSARQISHPEIIATIESALWDSGMPAERLWAEVTESTVLEDAVLAQTVFRKINALGAAVAIDDFGTGYSSLLYLKRYPVAALKVDRQFVSGIGNNEDDEAIVASIVSLAHAVGAVCIAEGVETAAQYAALRALGCEYAQGYLFGRPVAAGGLMESLENCRTVLAQPTPRPAVITERETPVLPHTVLTRITELHSEGASLHTIAAALNREVSPGHNGLRWRSTSVARVVATLAGPTYRGDAEDRNGS